MAYNAALHSKHVKRLHLRHVRIAVRAGMGKLGEGIVFKFVLAFGAAALHVLRPGNLAELRLLLLPLHPAHLFQVFVVHVPADGLAWLVLPLILRLKLLCFLLGLPAEAVRADHHLIFIVQLKRIRRRRAVAVPAGGFYPCLPHHF